MTSDEGILKIKNFLSQYYKPKTVKGIMEKRFSLFDKRSIIEVLKEEPEYFNEIMGAIIRVYGK